MKSVSAMGDSTDELIEVLRDAREDYLALFRDAGWEFLGQVANRYYFRAGPHASSPEIFSDVESRRERIRRQMRLCAILTGLLAFYTSMGVTQILSRLAGQSTRNSMGGSVLTAIVGGAGALLGVWCLWQMEQAWKRQQ